ncbi:arylsulfatase G-like [Saccoglossus kowalevskii]|uniref:Arylsulfatase G-like n=1 Tax=Saccoglossus kowalevskii TaxID=10224 RepID=A0ABM0MD34_SACKO|nr:PREDICTED: arylsulfatase G-like [Saccoglossus kowalevskii]
MLPTSTLTAVTLFTVVSVVTGDERPNFIILFADDMAWGDLGANWNLPKTASDTPNLDELSEGGMRFTDFHAAASICSPSRASLLTGRLGIRNGITQLVPSAAVGGLPLNETTFAEVLHDAGYSTAMIGKWHLGNNGSFHPINRGFDYYFGLPFSPDSGCTDVPGRDIPSRNPCPKDLRSSTPLSGRSDYDSFEDCTGNSGYALPLYENYTVVEQPLDLWNLSASYAEKTVNFLKQTQNSDKPFLMYVAFTHMHVPLGHGSKFTNMSVNGFFGDTLREMDNIVGDIMSTLRAIGKEDNTMVWFTSDNGPWVIKCQYAGSQGPYIGKWQEIYGGGGSTGKLTPWEAGHREPALVYWPGRIKPGQVSDSLLSAMDIFPTIATIAGVAMPANRKFDGIDITEVLFGGKRIYDGRALFHPNSASSGTMGDLNTVRVGRYKALYLTGQDFAPAAACGGKTGPVQWHSLPLIFNIDTDPAESSPLNQTSAEYKAALGNIQNALIFIMDDIANDNTTIANWNTEPSCKPCCNPNHVACRCKD